MANAHSIKARIKSVESIGQITRSMKMVAASKLRRSQKAMGAMSVMAEKSGEMLCKLLAADSKTSNPYLLEREKKSLCFVLFVGNRGLCGSYNNALLRYAELLMERCETDCFAVVCGSWGQDVIEPSGIKVLRRFADMGDVPSAAEAQELSEYLKQLYTGGQADEVVLVYQQYKSLLQQQPGQKILFPLRPDKPREGAAETEYIFEPDRETVISALVERYIGSSVFAAMLEARIGEHAARMTSMSSASDNTDELLASLKLALNHARQAAITTEISEIVGGAQALNNGR